MFSQSTIEQIGYYVYFLRNPNDRNIFYIGKGSGNRVYAHLNLEDTQDAITDKVAIIKEIIDSGKIPEAFIIRHGLNEETAFEIESTLIDFVGINNIANIQRGRMSSDYGLMSVDEVESLYNAEILKTAIPLILININKLFRREMTTNEIYEATRKSWVIAERRNKAQYAVSTYRGLTREVFKIHNWFMVEDHNGKNRWAFNGVVAENDIRKMLNHKSIAPYFSKGSANPIRYVNC